jgi:hypothetical protein
MTFEREYVKKFVFSVQDSLKRTDVQLEQLMRESNENVSKKKETSVICKSIS